MKALYRYSTHPLASLSALMGCVLLVPIGLRLALDWSDPLGYLSDLGIGGLLIALLYRRPWWLALPVLLAWSALTLASIELVSAVGRMPTPSDVLYLIDPQFVENSTSGGFAHPWLAAFQLAALASWLMIQWTSRRPLTPSLPRHTWALPVLLLLAHGALQAWRPSEADQWNVFNLPHQLVTAGIVAGQERAQQWLEGDTVDPLPPMEGLTRLDLNGAKLLAEPGRARNVLVIALEGIPGAYVSANREALNSRYQENLMPHLSRWAERGMNTPDYVLHSHQTIRGLYAMLCGDYDKLNDGTPKGVEMLNQAQRNQACLPAQLRQNGFSTHFLQGAGLRFMAKDRIMPHIGFDTTLGMDWFTRPAYLEFPWGKDDKTFFEGALDYVGQLQQADKPWMLTLLTVGTHQPYSAPEDYLQRYDSAKQAAVGYLDDALDSFLAGLERQGILENTLVVITSDESHGIDDVRLASSWGFNLTLAPEPLPRLKSGTYGHVDLTASILDYFGFAVPTSLSGRSLFRDYATGREIMSFTNGKLRYHDGKGTFTECDFLQHCRYYTSEGFIADRAIYGGQYSGQRARLISARATALDQTLLPTPLNQHYQFGSTDKIPLPAQVTNDWTDNLIGAQYLEMPKGSQTRVSLTIRAVEADHAAYISLKAKEFEQDVPMDLPTDVAVTADQPLVMNIRFDNPQQRKAFSFHLLGHGMGAIEISDFSVVTELQEQTDQPEYLDDMQDDSEAQSS
ncbi:phosphoglycerol transferase MdoB-like AlkP superfamily enzyme [Pseudomonas brassicacearum]|uniref:Phosphoglycerol transferase MdoB-like AlkP superfamily enzyme n=1 Tax=Pseudomonas brassicacearum TaxID=930166 RepID=A0AAW8MJX9_9PSED|nr:LTA synthase family protein [Pseudomonas brassicacearum]MDR6961601.1 phosphoglycerol transferase MdoB-like AlkP superfamily enzyme [Pseudomonas brassicacearum]